jgi:hypothetical protein
MRRFVRAKIFNLYYTKKIVYLQNIFVSFAFFVLRVGLIFLINCSRPQPVGVVLLLGHSRNITSFTTVYNALEND